MNWQSIETAPKDGTEFLAFDYTRFICIWSAKQQRWCESTDANWTRNPDKWHPLPPEPGTLKRQAAEFVEGDA